MRGSTEWSQSMSDPVTPINQSVDRTIWLDNISLRFNYRSKIAGHRIVGLGENIMKKEILILIITAFFSAQTFAAEEDFLNWTAVTIQCGNTPEAGSISCEIQTGETGWKKFSVKAFGNTYNLTDNDLTKLKGFPLSSMQTTHCAGYERLGGYSISFRFSNTFYNNEKKLITETVRVTVNKKKITISKPQTKKH